MSDNKRNGSFAGKGYYIALILCAAAIGITSYVYYRNAESVQEAAVEETWADVVIGTSPVEDVPVLATQPQASTAPATAPVPAQPTVPAPTEKPVQKVLKTVSPVSGETISGYSMEALSYNQTTRDWRVHDGLDLAAEAGAEVLAAADGEVYTVYEDDAMGHTVVIRHTGGYTTKYCSLSENIPVKAGDTVTMGQTIGYASDSAILETTLGAHVHFSVTCQGELMDPLAFLALGQ